MDVRKKLFKVDIKEVRKFREIRKCFDKFNFQACKKIPPKTIKFHLNFFYGFIDFCLHFFFFKAGFQLAFRLIQTFFFLSLSPPKKKKNHKKP